MTGGNIAQRSCLLGPPKWNHNNNNNCENAKNLANLSDTITQRSTTASMPSSLLSSTWSGQGSRLAPPLGYAGIDQAAYYQHHTVRLDNLVRLQPSHLVYYPQGPALSSLSHMTLAPLNGPIADHRGAAPGRFHYSSTPSAPCSFPSAYAQTQTTDNYSVSTSASPSVHVNGYAHQRAHTASDAQAPLEKPIERLRKCFNCGIFNTPSWRRCGPEAIMLCNACGLYYNEHKVHRPFRKESDGRTRALRIPRPIEEREIVCQGPCSMLKLCSRKRCSDDPWKCSSCARSTSAKRARDKTVS